MYLFQQKIGDQIAQCSRNSSFVYLTINTLWKEKRKKRFFWQQLWKKDNYSPPPAALL